MRQMDEVAYRGALRKKKNPLLNHNKVALKKNIWIYKENDEYERVKSDVTSHHSVEYKDCPLKYRDLR